MSARLRLAAGRALALSLAALRSEPGRRLGRLALLGAALAGAVVVLYQHGDTPAALARPAVATAAPAPAARAAPAAAHAATPGRGSATSRANQDGADRSGPGRGQAAGVERQLDPSRPADVAIAWYAARNHLPPGKVRALQQDVVSQRKVRVLVMADRGQGRLDTALVTVRRDAAGGWSVP